MVAVGGVFAVAIMEVVNGGGSGLEGSTQIISM